ncbi:MAG: 2-oxoglutarate dehydrogenase E1 component, partial [Ignavibacterium sp.]|nr:2-oxoglutarate dehydrogenase E1 component [Ignavibacterium sp.]
VYYDLIKYREKNNISDTAILRIEQFYPFRKDKLNYLLISYANAKNIFWVQEEPKNMGAWNFLSTRISDIISDTQHLICVSRPEGASPAVGSGKLSLQQQVQLVKEAFSS